MSDREEKIQECNFEIIIIMKQLISFIHKIFSSQHFFLHSICSACSAALNCE